MTDQEEWASLVKEINQGASLSDWEEKFIDDMLDMIEKDKPFTNKQGAMIERIYEQRINQR